MGASAEIESLLAKVTNPRSAARIAGADDDARLFILERVNGGTDKRLRDVLPFLVWVGTAEPKGAFDRAAWECACEIAYPLVWASIAELVQRFGLYAPPGLRIGVCACQGRFIE